jgi:hypothetical protein
MAEISRIKKWQVSLHYKHYIYTQYLNINNTRAFPYVIQLDEVSPQDYPTLQKDEPPLVMNSPPGGPTQTPQGKCTQDPCLKINLPKSKIQLSITKRKVNKQTPVLLYICNYNCNKSMEYRSIFKCFSHTHTLIPKYVTREMFKNTEYK